MLGIGGRGLLMLVNMAVLMVTSRLLSPAQFGTFAVAVLCLDFVAALASSLAMPLLARGTKEHRRWREGFTLLALAGLAGGLLLGVAARPLERALNMPGLAALLLVTAALLVFRFLVAFTTAALQREARVRELVVAQTRAQIIAALGVTLPLTLLGFGVWGLMAGLATAIFLELLLCARASSIRIGLAIGAGSVSLLREARAPMVQRGLVFASDAVDRAGISVFFGAAPLGLYTRATNLVQIPANLIGIPLQNSLLSWFAHFNGDLRRAGAGLERSTEIQSFILFPLVVGAVLGSPVLIAVLLGQQWVAAVPLAQLLFVGVFARLAAVPLESASLTLGHAGGAARRQMASALLLAAGLAAAFPFGLEAVAAVVALSRFAYYLLTLRYAVLVFGLKTRLILLAHLKGLALALVLAAVALGLVRTLREDLLGSFLVVLLYGLLLIAALLWAPRWALWPGGSRLRSVLRHLRFLSGLRRAVDR